MNTQPQLSNPDAEQFALEQLLVEIEAELPSLPVTAKKEKSAPKAKFKDLDNSVERLHVTLKSYDDALVLEKSDLSLERSARDKQVLAVSQEIRSAGVKVQGRITMILEYLDGKTDELNRVMRVGFELLRSEGVLTSGKEGNFQKALVADGLSERSAGSMTVNALNAFRVLKIVKLGDKQNYQLNPESVLFERFTTKARP